MENQPDIIAANYCISFVDLLGQRAEYKGEALLPQSESDRRHFLNKIKKTINPIYHLQKDASQYTIGNYCSKRYIPQFLQKVSAKRQIKKNLLSVFAF